MQAFERLMEYVTIHTTANEETHTHPSFQGEFDLARALVSELLDMGIQDVFVDEKCYVYASLPATLGCEECQPIGFIAHMDTSPDASGDGVEPVLHQNYDGKDIVLGTSGRVLSVSKFPFLKNYVGETLITTDGTTLLGGDDKAGIAEIMTALERIQEEKLPHGTIYIAFTPDEEIGEGADFFDLNVFKAAYAYTVDGGDVDCIEYENFNAASATVRVKGLSVHPGSAKNTMINACNVAVEFHTSLPEAMRPEHTEGREGFFHLTDMSGFTSEAVLKYIIRDHDRNLFEAKKALMKEKAALINEKYGDGTLMLEIEDSYYNMLEKILPHMHLIENAKEAIASLGLSPVEVPIRGGTDGARLSYMGLPCPNLGTGGFNFHGELEGISVERMEKAVEIILYIVGKYSRKLF